MITARLDESKHKLVDLKAWKNASIEARQLFEQLLNRIDGRLKSEGKQIIFEVVIGGVSAKDYPDQKAAFIFVNLLKIKVTAKYFTGASLIPGLRKDYWINPRDGIGSERSPITNAAEIAKHESFASRSFDIRMN